MFWALLSALVFGGTATTPLVNQIELIGKNAVRSGADKSHVEAIEATVKQTMVMNKDYQSDKAEFLKSLQQLALKHKASKEEYATFTHRMDEQQADWDHKMVDQLLQAKANLTAGQWSALFGSAKTTNSSSSASKITR
jgi:hypothetical protein